MSVAIINQDTFEASIQQHEIVIIDFWAEWCAPCKAFAPVFDEVSALYPNVHFAKVNVEENPEMSDVFEIRSIPFLMIFKKGVIIYADSGAMPKTVLTELVEQALKVELQQDLQGDS